MIWRSRCGERPEPPTQLDFVYARGEAGTVRVMLGGNLARKKISTVCIASVSTILSTYGESRMTISRVSRVRGFSLVQVCSQGTLGAGGRPSRLGLHSDTTLGNYAITTRTTQRR